MSKIAFVTGICGQDGSYIAELLLQKGYVVHGLVRRSSSHNTQRIDHIKNPEFILHYGDMTDLSCLIHLIGTIRPTEIYNLAAQSHVLVSFEMPIYTAQADAIGTVNLLEAIRTCGLSHTCKMYQASTSELYGKVQEIPQKETTPFYPRSPYGASKLYAYWIVKNYRESYGMFVCNGILFNHESPRRGLMFVTRKITRAIAEGETLYLGNLNSKRDWGHAKDYVEGMWLMLQQETPEDYVLATGECHSVREFVEESYRVLGKEIKWNGEGIDEVGIVDNEIVVRIDPKLYRPAEVDLLLGDATKAKIELGWEHRVSFIELVRDMMLADIEMVKKNIVY